MHQVPGVDGPVELGVLADRQHAARDLAGHAGLEQLLIGGIGVLLGVEQELVMMSPERAREDGSVLALVESGFHSDGARDVTAAR